MSALTDKLNAACLKAIRSTARLLGGEDGQSATEYALISFAMVSGSMVGLFVFAPRAINLYNAYIHGFYLLLGLPVP